MANLCKYCGKGDEFYKVVDINSDESLLKCIICGYNNTWEDIFPVKVKFETSVDCEKPKNQTIKIDKQDKTLINKK